MKKVLLILALLFAILVAAVVGGLYYLKTKIEEDPGALVDRMMDFAGGEEVKQKIALNESAIADALRAYVKAQATYKSDNGRYAHNLSKLDLPAGMKQADMDGFTSGGNKSFTGEGYKGYNFAHVPKNGTQGMNYEEDFVLCAFPAMHRMTGIHTLAIGPKGIVLQGGTDGLPVHNATEFSDGSWTALPDPE